VSKIIPKQLLCATKFILDFYFGGVEEQTVLALGGAKKEDFGKEALYRVAKESNLELQEGYFNPKKVEKFMLPFIACSKDGEVVVVTDITQDGFVCMECETKTKQNFSKRDYTFFQTTKREVAYK